MDTLIKAYRYRLSGEVFKLRFKLLPFGRFYYKLIFALFSFLVAWYKTKAQYIKG